MALNFPSNPAVGQIHPEDPSAPVRYICVRINQTTGLPDWDVYSSGIVSGMQAGSIIWHGAPVVPFGFIICDGRAVSRSTYSALFAVIGVTFGAGDGTTTFNVPGMLGRFIRGHNGTASGIDPNRVFGSMQDATRHPYSSIDAQSFFIGPKSLIPQDADEIMGQTTRTVVQGIDQGTISGWYKSRPTNIALTPIIRAFDSINDPALLNAAGVVAKVDENEAGIADLNRFAVLSDVKASNTPGGSSVANTRTRRVLNTIDDPSSMVTLNADNTFTPNIDCVCEYLCPFYAVSYGLTFLKNVTDDVDVKTGSGFFTVAGTANSTAHSFAGAKLEAGKTYSIEYLVSVASGSTDLGIGHALGDNIYTVVTLKGLA